MAIIFLLVATMSLKTACKETVAYTCNKWLQFCLKIQR
jgi:hypothetical protein